MKAIYGEKYYTRYIYKEKGLKRKNNTPAGKSNQLFSCFPEKQNAFGQKVAALQNRGAASPHHALRLPVVRYPPPKNIFARETGHHLPTGYEEYDLYNITLQSTSRTSIPIFFPPSSKNNEKTTRRTKNPTKKIIESMTTKSDEKTAKT